MPEVMAQVFRAVAALTEEPDLASSTHISSPNYLFTIPVSKDIGPLLTSIGAACMLCKDIHEDKHTQNKN